jgi:hypothetical protein
MTSTANSSRSEQEFELHPLIHTFLEFNLAQDIESTRSGAAIAPLLLFEK